MKPILFIVVALLLSSTGCGTILYIQEEGLAPFCGVTLDFIGVVIGLTELHPMGLLALLDLPFSLVADLILFFPSLAFSGG